MHTDNADPAVSKRFHVELFIVHPTADPAGISATLGMDANFFHRVGDKRKTPKGTMLSGTYPDTRWRHSRGYQTTDQTFADKIGDLVAGLEQHKTFLEQLRLTGGRACVILQFLGDGYFGDEIPISVLGKLAELSLDFAIECFTVPQNGGSMKNIQIIDGARNCTFSIFQATTYEFALLFPEFQQEIQYSEDLAALPNQDAVQAALVQIWERPIRKRHAHGIHGTLFFELDRYKAWYREKREDAIAPSAVNQAQRRLFEDH